MILKSSCLKKKKKGDLKLSLDMQFNYFTFFKKKLSALRPVFGNSKIFKTHIFKIWSNFMTKQIFKDEKSSPWLLENDTELMKNKEDF